ncbi:MAG TPA: DUF2079 domain-containing protein [Acidimicrobiales bacterium]|nr:DUF2079 domain-containing protein [Acidimicrobiales bacterium]
MLVVQFVAMVSWNALEFNRFVQTWDFAAFYHAWYVILHGDLTYPSWRGEGVFITWPLSLVSLVNSSPMTLLVIQDVATVGAELVAFYWFTEIAWKQDTISPSSLSFLGLFLLVADPWIYWSVSWDYHSEAVGTLFAILAARALFRNRKQAWIWIVLTFLSGVITAAFIFGIGVSRILKRGKGWYLGVVACLSSVGWISLLAHFGVGGAAFATSIGRGFVVSGAFAHSPASVVSDYVRELTSILKNVWFNRGDVLANLAPTGFVSALATPAIGVVAQVLAVTDSQTGTAIVPPSHNDVFVYVIVPIGAVVALIWLARRFGPRVTRVLMALMALNVTAWSIVWLPHLATQWLGDMSSSSAAVVRRAEARIPANADVLVSQGIMGDFGWRPNLLGLTIEPPWRVPVSGKDVWLIVTPHRGIEIESVMAAYDIIDTFVDEFHAQVVADSNDVWVLKWKRPSSVNAVSFGSVNRSYPAWLFPSAVGRVVRSGNRSHWYLSVSGANAGYVLWGDDWLEQTGHYMANVTFRSTGQTSVQVWNDTNGREVATRQYAGTNGIIRASFPVTVTPGLSNHPFSGFGPFRIDPQPALPGKVIEMRVWTAKGVKASVYSISMQRVH